MNSELLGQIRIVGIGKFDQPNEVVDGGFSENFFL